MDDSFSVRETASGMLMISRGGRVVGTLGGKAAERVRLALAAAADSEGEQLVLAKATGNYKRGNERR